MKVFSSRLPVLCIKEYPLGDGHTSKTTIGKTYELFEYKNVYGVIGYYFIDDFGFGNTPMNFEEYFITLEQWREQQLNLIGV